MVKNHNNVILSMPEPKEWTFLSFVTQRGVDVVEIWDIPRTFEAELGFWAMIKNCRRTGDFLQWTAFRHRMHHDAGKAGVVELEFRADRKPYRVLCKFTGKKCVILLCVCYHKNSNWTPRNALDLATERAKAIDEKRARTNVIPNRDDI
jgi:phage-related protein